MPVPNRFILHQAPTLAAMGKTAIASALAKKGSAPKDLPGPTIEKVIPPRPRDLVRHYAKAVGGDPSAYKRVLPPHLFPQWGFAFATQTLVGLDYPLARVLNAGCRMEIHAPLPNDEPLTVSTRLESIEDNGYRALLTMRIVTGTNSAPAALVAYMHALVPYKKNEDKKPKEPARVPADAREVGFSRLSAAAGLEFAKLTGDFNPIHWVPAYARMSGFKSCILHGFATLAHAYEALVKNVFSGNTHPFSTFEVRFTSPLLLPARVGTYLATDADGGDIISVGDAPGGRAYLTGSFTRSES